MNHETNQPENFANWVKPEPSTTIESPQITPLSRVNELARKFDKVFDPNWTRLTRQTPEQQKANMTNLINEIS